MIVLFWDIDGTLLTTGRAGIFALEAAASAIRGEPVDLQDMRTAGLTDAQIAERIVGEAEVEPFLTIYASELPAALPRRTGAVLPNVAAILADLAGDPEVESLLLTGNVRGGARAKLRHYGLDRWLTDGAFCEGPGPRDDIARRAYELVRERAGGDQCYVIGDTPHDIRCGHAIGARTIAVATGGYTLEELETWEPTAALEALPDPAAFRRLVGLEGSRVIEDAGQRPRENGA